MTIQDYRDLLQQRKGKKLKLDQQISELTEEITEQSKELKRHEKALEILKLVGLKTQQQLQFHISNITSLALSAVFKDPYELKVEFVERRNKTECDLTFERRELKIDPIEAAGLGAVDIASFALRIASWSMQSPRSTNTILLDEPFKHLRGEGENERALQMLKEICNKLNLQIIMIGDVKINEDIMLEYADKVFKTSLINDITKIKEL